MLWLKLQLKDNTEIYPAKVTHLSLKMQYNLLIRISCTIHLQARS